MPKPTNSPGSLETIHGAGSSLSRLFGSRLFGSRLPGSRLFGLIGRLNGDVIKYIILDRVRPIQKKLGLALCRVPCRKTLFSFLLLDVTSAARESSREANGVVDATRIAEARAVELRDPDRSSLLQAWGYSASVTIPPRVRYTIRDAFLSLRSGAVCAANYSIIEECNVPSRFPGRRLQETIFGMPRPLRALRLPGTYSTIWGIYGRNYYHWLIECLPRTALLKDLVESQEMRLVMPRDIPAAQRDSLSCCLPEGIEVDYIAGKGWVQLERLILLPYGTKGSAAYLPEDDRNYIRSAVFRRYGLDPAHSGVRRIYVSRGLANTRRVVNEEEVCGLLERHGFEPVRLETLSFEDQVRLFHSAGIVVGSHGAGLSNLLFGGRLAVVELFGRRFTPFFLYLAHAMGQRYCHLMGTPQNRLGDFRVDAGKLEAAVLQTLRPGA